MRQGCPQVPFVWPRVTIKGLDWADYWELYCRARLGGGKEIFVCYIQTLSLVQLERAEFGLFIPAKIFEKY